MDRNCDICSHHEQKETPAIVDGPTNLGPHAYMCEKHFQENGFPGSSINTFLDKIKD